jgi:hypothetical protein
MRRSQSVLLLALVAGSAIGVAAVLMDPSTSEARHQASADLPARVGALTGENRELAYWLGAPENRPSDQGRVAVADGAASRGESDTRAAESPKPATLTELRDFREYVDSTISELRKQEAATKITALEAQAASLDETMPTTEAWLKLTPHQSDKMRSVLLTRLDREAEYLRLWADGADEEILGELRKGDREARLSELTGLLTAEQLREYLAREGKE